MPNYAYFDRNILDITKFPGWTFSGGTTTNGANRYAEDTSGNLVAFASGLPRITNKGFLVEEARTNLLLRSQEFDNAAWIRAGAPTVVANNVVAPDGTQTADTVSGATTGLYQSAVVPSGTSVGSVYAKAGTATSFNLTVDVGGNGRTVAFDLTNGTAAASTQVGTGGTVTSLVGSVQALSGGWYRCVVVATTTDANNFAVALTSANTIALWQADLSAAPFPTSPIVTTTAAATRAADNASVTGLGGILTAPVTLVAWAQLPAADGIDRGLAAINDGGSTNRVFIRRNTGNAMAVSISAGGVGQPGDTQAGYSGASVPKVAQRITAAAQKAAFNGALSAGAVITAPTGMNRLDLGAAQGGGASYLNGYIQRVAILGDTTDAELRALAT